MTRIIAGVAGGRALITPRGPATRPTTDRVREAVFSRVESLLDLPGACVLDLYAGSGAMGLEAASRGAHRVQCVESERGVAQLITRNVRTLGLPAVQVRADRVERTLSRGPGDTAYDLVLADPPYRLGEEDVVAMLRALLDHRWLGPSAVVVLERPSHSPAPRWPAPLVPLRSKAFGATTVHDAVAD